MTDYPAERPLTPAEKLAARQRQARDEGLVAPRRPDDHKPKDDDFKPYGTRPVDVDFLGQTWTVIPTVLDDWDMVEKQAAGLVEEISLPSQFLSMLGYDQYEELKEVVKAKHGYLSARVMGGFMQTVQKQLDSGNS